MSDSLDLCDAIIGNSPCLVEYCLTEEHRDPNGRPKLALLENVLKDSAGRVDETERILAEAEDYTCAPLHIAVLNAYHNGRMDGIASRQRDRALQILDLLLDAKADVSMTCNRVLFCNVGDLNISSPGAPLDPISLALSLKKVKSSSIHADERIEMMDEVLSRLVAARNKQKRLPTPKVSISKLIADTYRDMYLSLQYCDVILVCLDGVELPAHRNILAASSPVFQKAFLPDVDNVNNNNTSSSSSRMMINRNANVVKAVLYFLYTGEIDESVLESETASLLSVASEYQLEALEQLCAGKCGERLTIQNVRIMLDIGERHQARWVKKECLDFLQRQPLQVVLAHPKILILAKENPKLWQEILMAIGGDVFELRSNAVKSIGILKNGLF
jgi:BTB/POZ domain